MKKSRLLLAIANAKNDSQTYFGVKLKAVLKKGVRVPRQSIRTLAFKVTSAPLESVENVAKYALEHQDKEMGLFMVCQTHIFYKTKNKESREAFNKAYGDFYVGYVRSLLKDKDFPEQYQD